jgi:hypothetical protein
MSNQHEFTPALLKPLKPARLARQLRDAGSLVDAYLIYAWLALHSPQRPGLRRKRDRCRKLLIRQYPNLASEPSLFTSALHSDESINARLLNCLIRHAPVNQLDPLYGFITGICATGLQIPLAMNWHARRQEWSAWAEQLTHFFHHCRLGGAVTLADGTRRVDESVLARLSISSTACFRSVDSLVTVVITAHNAASTLGYAVRSIVGQSHQNLEIIIVNDASTDGTADQLEVLARQDNRIRVIHNHQRRGTYACRNQALGQARGMFIANHDADDYAHPDRFNLQLSCLAREPDAPAVLGQWLRITADGYVNYHNRRGGGFLHGALATIVVRREVVNRIGFYDPVLCSADTEYLFRIRRVWGGQAVPVIRRPLVLAASLGNGLSSDPNMGTDSFLGDSPCRIQYRKAWESWHQATQHADLYMPIAGGPRPFPAPAEMLAIRPV